MDEIEQRAAEIVRRGLARIDELEAEAARIRELLADPELLKRRAEAQLAEEADTYWWEDRDPNERGVRVIRAGRTSSYATGEGLTTFRFATFASGDAGFRRAFVQHVGRELANVAVPDEALRKLCERRWSRGASAGGRSILICEHVNYA